MENPTCSISGERPRRSGGAEDWPSLRGERAQSRQAQERNDRSPSGAQDGDRRLQRDQQRSPARGWRLALDVSRGRPPVAPLSTSHGFARGGRTPRQEVRRAGLRRSDARGSMGHPTEPRSVRRSHVRESGACSRTLIWTDCSDSGAERIPQLIKAGEIHPVRPCRRLDISWSVPSRLPLVKCPGGDTLSACHDLEGT
jgi:hypothetical protein